MAQTVYILCAATSVLCAILLARGYLRTRARLLLWSALCFVFLSVNNILLFVDLAVYPERDLALMGVGFPLIRSVFALMGVGVLVFGLIWDSD